ncbi:hypothetical protein UB48_23990 [Pseudomonas sp. 2(2015)]|nr:hypothetical protein UB48_23990 [Pseudomonas sp. 2(2015)]
MNRVRHGRRQQWINMPPSGLRGIGNCREEDGAAKHSADYRDRKKICLLVCPLIGNRNPLKDILGTLFQIPQIEHLTSKNEVSITWIKLPHHIRLIYAIYATSRANMVLDKITSSTRLQPLINAFVKMFQVISKRSVFYGVILTNQT